MAGASVTTRALAVVLDQPGDLLEAQLTCLQLIAAAYEDVGLWFQQ